MWFNNKLSTSLNQLPEREESSLEETSKRTVERYLFLQRLLNHYWKQWKQEYLHLLSVESKWHKEIHLIREGDIVPFSDDNVPRTKWPLAKVERVYPGNDGLVWTATVREAQRFLQQTRSTFTQVRDWDSSFTSKPRSRGFSPKQTLFMLQIYLFPNLNWALSSPKEDKVGRTLQPVLVLEKW